MNSSTFQWFFGALPWLGIMVLLLLPGAAGSAHAGAFKPPCRVTPGGNSANNGMSWATPMTLQSALQDNLCKEIWLHEGIYKPTTDASDRAASFEVTRDVKLYGGFDGSETSRGERDPVTHLSILSGDIDGNDVTNAAGITETYHDQRGGNSYHVLMLDGTAASGPITFLTILDGFVITAGNAINTASLDDGGGLYCNAGEAGSKCSPALRDLAFFGNGASYHGGGMHLEARNGGESSPQINRVVFSGNSAYGNYTTNGGSGGALASRAFTGSVSSPFLTDVVFCNNSSRWYGGAVYNESFGSGAVSHPNFLRVTFVNNTAGWPGGGMFNISKTNASTKPYLANVTFVGNSGMKGGAMGNRAWAGTVDVSIVNATFAGNSSSFGEGSTLYNTIPYSSGTMHADLTNVILWDDVDGVEIFKESGTLSIDYSIVRGGSNGIIDSNLDPDPAFGSGASNLAGDPLLGPLWDNGGFSKTMLLGMNSAAVDSGDDNLCPMQDQRRAPRLTRNRCDIGAVERVLPDSDIIFRNGFELH